MYVNLPDAGTYYIFDTNAFICHLPVIFGLTPSEKPIVLRIVWNELTHIVETYWNPKYARKDRQAADAALRFIGDNTQEHPHVDDVLFLCNSSLAPVEYAHLMQMFAGHNAREHFNDNLILYCAQQIKESKPDSRVVVVTEDAYMGGSALTCLDGVELIRPQELYRDENFEKTPEGYWNT